MEQKNNEHRVTLRLSQKTYDNVQKLFELWQEKPYLISNFPSTTNARFNMLIRDFTQILLTLQSGTSKKNYEDLLKASLGTKDPVAKLLHKDNLKLMDRINAMFYLLMISNKVLAENGGLKELESMFEFGTREYAVFHELQRMVDEDNKRLFINTKNRKKI
ncbi:hypothetical protein PO252_08195 [Limosilactobacillus mucosae]|uniref:hypothetical protein n=1 Tax=Limosilactobacillus mucosae TaxID=97478 RepID=UPI00233EC8B4|nr:hypothetical protein [Limosilactobacillus mucosae]MDC2839795.1 hypothetical protein [Limosilactobacillus mucosae]